MFGIRHDDYDYREVNELLGHNLKSYVKTVTCYPERVTRKEYDSFMYEFKHSEKVIFLNWLSIRKKLHYFSSYFYYFSVIVYSQLT